MFAHPIMLAGIGGAMLPLVVHLLNRARYRNIRWGAMMFLAGSEDGGSNALSRLRVPLILFLRMAIVALLAMALARPIAHSSSDSRLCVVVLFDNGAGMSFDEGTAGTRMETARAAALAFVKQLQRDDEVHVLPLSGESSNTEATDLQSAVSQIADLHVSASRADISEGFNNAARLPRSDIPRKVIILIADREAVSWRGVTEVSAATFRQQMLSYGNNLRMLFVPIGSESSENVAIDRITLPPPPLVQGETIAAQVMVHNYGSVPLSSVPVELRVVGQRSDARKTVDLPAGSAVNVEFRLATASPGYYLTLARIGDDAKLGGGVTFDDSAEAVANVVDAIPVLIIGDNDPRRSTSAPATNASDQAEIFAIASAPFASSGTQGTDLAKPTIVSAESHWLSQLESNQVLIWCAHRSPTTAESEELKRFTVNGGGVLLPPAAGASAAINTLFDADGGLSPVSLRPVSTTRPTTRPTTLVLTASFRRQQLLSPADALRCVDGITLDHLAAVDRHSNDAELLAQTADGHAWLIGRPFGKGHVLVATSSVDRTGGNFPERPALVPLTRAMMHWLAAGRASRFNLNTGEPFELHDLPASSAAASVTLPDGTHQQVIMSAPGDGPSLRFLNTFAAGRYQVEIETAAGKQTIPFVVRPARDASDLTPIPAQRLNRIEQIANLLPVTVQSPAEGVAALDRDEPHDLWLPLLVAVVALVLVELLLSNRFSDVAA